MKELNECLFNIGVDYMITKGFYFTWDNKREGLANIQSKIDRGLCNNAWQQLFDYYEVEAKEPGISYHCPLVITVKKVNMGRRPFKFFNFWMELTLFKRIVERG